MNKAAVREFFGSQATLARRLGFTPAAISKWLSTDPVPYHVQCMIQVESDGVLRANPNDKPTRASAA